MKLKPDLYYNNIYEIDYEQLWNNGIRAFLFDIDNTLATYDNAYPDEKLMLMLSKLKNKGFKVYFLSNNNKERVRLFSEFAGLPYKARACKPLKFFIKRAIKQLGETKNTVVLVGDQLFTDVWGANRLGILSILVNPISPKEDKFVAFKRKLEKYFINKI